MNSSAQSNTVFQSYTTDFLPASPSIASLPEVGRRVRVSLPRSIWMIELRERFNELTSLPIGWDGYQGHPVRFLTAFFAANLIEQIFSDDVPTPSLVPGSDGSLQIEWHCNNFDIEIDVLAPMRIIASRYNHLTDQDEEFELDNDFSILSDWINDLSVDQEVIEQHA